MAAVTRLRRRQDWSSAFNEAYMARVDRGFRWGRHDCACAVAAVVQAMTGVDIMRGLRRTSKAGVDELLRRKGGLRKLARQVAKAHGIPRVEAGFAQRGDVVVLRLDSGPVLGIVDLSARNVLVAAKVGWQAYALRPAIEAGAVADTYGIGRDG